MSPSGRPPGRPPGRVVLEAMLNSDGTLAGTVVTLNGVPLDHVAAVDLHIDPTGSTLHVSLGHVVIDYGRPSAVDVRGARASVDPAPTPRE